MFDNFDRADETPLAAPYGPQSTWPEFNLSSNHAVPSGSNAHAVLDVGDADTDVSVTFEVGNPPDAYGVTIGYRVSDKKHLLFFRQGNNWWLYRLTDMTVNELIASGGQSGTSTVVMKVAAVGDTYELFVDGTSVWVGTVGTYGRTNAVFGFRSSAATTTVEEVSSTGPVIVDQMVVTDLAGKVWTSPTAAVSFTGHSSVTLAQGVTDRNGTYVGDGFVSTDDAATFTAGAAGDGFWWDGSLFWRIDGNALYSSSDGVTWTLQDSFVSLDDGCYGLTRASGRLLTASTHLDAFSNRDVLYTRDIHVASNSPWDEPVGGGSFSDLAGQPTHENRLLVSNGTTALMFVDRGSPTTGGKFWSGTGDWGDFVVADGTDLWCAAWDGSQWVAGGRGCYATSPDGETWTDHAPGALTGWQLLDVFHDGTKFWFAATSTANLDTPPGADVGAVFETVDGSTWTRHDLPAGSLGAYSITGAPQPLAIQPFTAVTNTFNAAGDGTEIVHTPITPTSSAVNTFNSTGDPTQTFTPTSSAVNTFNGAGDLRPPILPTSSATNTFNSTGEPLVGVDAVAAAPAAVQAFRNALLDMDAGIGQVRSMVQFQVLDWELQHVGWVKPLKADSVEANTGATIKRQLQGFVLAATDLADVNVFEHRIRVWWVLEDGTRWPIGVFVFANSVRTRSTTVDRVALSMFDQSHILNQGTPWPYGLPTNGSISEAIDDILDLTGITRRSLPASPSSVVADPPNWPADTSRLKIISELCDLAGWLPPYFDNFGVFTVKVPPDIENEYPTHVYRPHRVKRAGLIENDNLLDAPNVYVVTGSGPTMGEITATAHVDPNLPFSVENRRYEVVSVTKAQSLTSTKAAQNMANALAAGAAKGYRNIQVDTTADPRHDLYQTVDWLGTVYRETSWKLPLKPGGPMSHTWTLGGFAHAG